MPYEDIEEARAKLRKAYTARGSYTPDEIKQLNALYKEDYKRRHAPAAKPAASAAKPTTPAAKPAAPVAKPAKPASKLTALVAKKSNAVKSLKEKFEARRTNKY